MSGVGAEPDKSPPRYTYAMRYAAVLALLVFMVACEPVEETAETTTPAPSATARPTATIAATPAPTPEPTVSPKIFFASERDPRGVYLMNADGSNPVRIGGNVSTRGAGRWSSDGTKVAYAKCPGLPDRNSELRVASVDGSEDTNVSNHPDPDVWICYTESPPGGFDWSPDGERLVFYSFREPAGLYVVNADGSDLTYLVDGVEPAWSPDGELIAFIGRRDEEAWRMDLEVIRPDGSGRRLLAKIPCVWSALEPQCFFFQPAEWSPDRSLLTFVGTANKPDPADESTFTAEVYTLRADGSGLKAITDAPDEEYGAAWVDCSRPTAGCEARVVNVGVGGLKVRDHSLGSPGFDVGVVGKLRESETVCLIGQAWYKEGYQWWPVRGPDGTEGWAAGYDPGAATERWLQATDETCSEARP